MDRVFKTRTFANLMKKSGLTDSTLRQAAAEMRAGLVDADLGGGLVKKRVALPGRGKRGGARTLVATNRSDRWFFVYGFAKSERANVSAEELEALKMLARDLVSLADRGIGAAMIAGTLTEIGNEQEDQ